ncbi:Gluconolactonase putatively [Suhomyces tanzawaensis NRRL Y-17324]|uniref:Gluconolactonase putatively n=1 Tax=Suhomyces tanzawaensis NRRL Y-17324 TaxID=984487 RepID=A0A1E4SHI6_9ASCO|nr:Gluconolactonase putatively [Suhomyces tanzawaensis NRRL Y-17324]ODV78974.1 Gluconolactonase putatively [Suhomyces tanzawaensis NRRL Y-17324]
MTESSTVALSDSDIFLPHYRGRLTEGITYNPSNDTLLWVDIIAGEVHRVFLSQEGSHHHQVLKHHDPQESVGAIALTSNDNVVLVCGKYGVAKGDFSTGQIEAYFFKYPHDGTRLRSNDGIVDPWGHLWIGVMTDFPFEPVKPEGRLYRINCHDLTIDTMIEDTRISNGLSFSANGKHLFWTDSLTFTVWQYDYDYITNTLSNKRPFLATTALFEGANVPEPDGLCMDKQGHVYLAMFNGSCVVHVDERGQLVEKIGLPALRITSVTVGGKNSDELYITTAHAKLADAGAVIDAADTSGDLGGFLFKYTCGRRLNGQIKNTWGGRS